MRILILVILISITMTVYADSDGKFSVINDKILSCVICHGEKGISEINLNPIIGGQHFYYIYTQLKDFKSRLRENTIMSPMTTTLEKEDMQLLAEYFSSQTWPKNDFKATIAQITLGRKVVDAGQCVACHLGGFEGNSRVPKLAGQHYEYLEKTMLDFKNKVRKNAAAKGSLFATFSDEEIRAVAAYLSGFKEE